jgi:hypothetical protein
VSFIGGAGFDSFSIHSVLLLTPCCATTNEKPKSSKRGSFSLSLSLSYSFSLSLSLFQRMRIIREGGGNCSVTELQAAVLSGYKLRRRQKNHLACIPYAFSYRLLNKDGMRHHYIFSFLPLSFSLSVMRPNFVPPPPPPPFYLSFSCVRAAASAAAAVSSVCSLTFLAFHRASCVC